MAGLNEAPSGERVAIGFFGVRNAGKSSLVNAVCGQDVAVVSDVAGTTTDPVRKSMELLPLGPVTIVDTPGFDDEGSLGESRVQRTRAVLDGIHVAVLVVDGTRGVLPADQELASLFREKGVAFVVALSKADLLGDDALLADGDAPLHDGDAQLSNGDVGVAEVASKLGAHASLAVSSQSGVGIHELKELLAHVGAAAERERRIVGDLVAPGDAVVLVCPIDEAAPKGRIILPQVQTIRDLLDAGAIPVVCRETELDQALQALSAPPALVVTDSQVFKQVAQTVDPAVPLTSFSILMARYKGDLNVQVKGARAIDALKDGDRVLIAEGCTHHRQCDDIGTVKLPRMIRNHTGANPAFEFTSGREFPLDLASYALVVHCGGCMLNDREVNSRLERAAQQGVPFTNYGVAIAKMTGILDRVVRPFGLNKN